MAAKTRLLGSSSLVRADAEETPAEEARDDAGAGTQLKDFINDMQKCMDSFGDSLTKLHSRMDSLEEESKEEKKDAEKEEEPVAEKKEDDAEEAEEAKVPAEPVRAAADKRKDAKRKDNGEDVSEAKASADEDEEEKKEEAHADADMVDLRKQIADLTRKLGDVQRIVPRPMSEIDVDALTDAQARADDVYSEFGKRAPVPLPNEDLMGYRRRVARDLRVHSPALKTVNLHAVADDTAFGELEKQIYADALASARSPMSVPRGELRSVTRRSGGHEITEFHGEPSSWMSPMSGHGVSYATEFLTTNSGR